VIRSRRLRARGIATPFHGGAAAASLGQKRKMLSEIAIAEAALDKIVALAHEPDRRGLTGRVKADPAPKSRHGGSSRAVTMRTEPARRSAARAERARRKLNRNPPRPAMQLRYEQPPENTGSRGGAKSAAGLFVFVLSEGWWWPAGLDPSGCAPPVAAASPGLTGSRRPRAAGPFRDADRNCPESGVITGPSRAPAPRTRPGW